MRYLVHETGWDKFQKMVLKERSIVEMMTSYSTAKMFDVKAEEETRQLPKASRTTTMARKLALSGPSLQRELNSRGTSYREELARLRREMALDMLPRESVPDIVAFLRFSESSAFYRAFRRWTGKTPQEYLDLLS